MTGINFFPTAFASKTGDGLLPTLRRLVLDINRGAALDARHGVRTDADHIVIPVKIDRRTLEILSVAGSPPKTKQKIFTDEGEMSPESAAYLRELYDAALKQKSSIPDICEQFAVFLLEEISGRKEKLCPERAPDFRDEVVSHILQCRKPWVPNYDEFFRDRYFREGNVFEDNQCILKLIKDVFERAGDFSEIKTRLEALYQYSRELYWANRRYIDATAY